MFRKLAFLMPAITAAALIVAQVAEASGPRGY